MNDEIKLEELTVYSYDIYLKEKRNTRLIKDVILVDLIQNDLYSVETYINVTNTIISISIINKYIKKGNIILVMADWPDQIFLRIAISQFLIYNNSFRVIDKILSFFSIIGPLHISLNNHELIFLQYQLFFFAMYKYIFSK